MKRTFEKISSAAKICGTSSGVLSHSLSHTVNQPSRCTASTKSSKTFPLSGVSSRAARIFKVGLDVLVMEADWYFVQLRITDSFASVFPKEPRHHKITFDPYILKRVA